MKRLAFLGFGTALAAVAVVGVAAALGPDSSGTIHACVKNSSGSVRVIASPGGCTNAESAVDWTQTAAFEVFIDDGVGTVITAVDPAPFQHVLTLPLPPGGYVVSNLVEVEKTSGDAIIVCRTAIGPVFASTRIRASIGTDPGDVRRASLSATGTAVFSGAGSVELQCRQRPGATGANPVVLTADITATRVGPVSSGFGS